MANAYSLKTHIFVKPKFKWSDRMQVISPNGISPKNLVESFRLRKLGEMTKRE